MKMKMFNWYKMLGCVLIFLLCATTHIYAQGRGGGGGGGGGGRGGTGGGGFGGFGGFGGGGFGGTTGGTTGNAARNTAATSTSQYNNNGTVGTAQISVDPDTHNLVIIADQDTIEQIRNVLANLDVPKPQVLIKVVFLEVSDNNASAIGVQGTYTGVNKNFSQVTGYMTNFIVANRGTATATIVPDSVTPINQSLNVNNNFGLPQALAGATGNGGLYQLMGSDFNATLQAIATAGKAQVLSRPSVLARDGQVAEIVVGKSIYLPSGVSFTTVGSGSTTVPTINGTYQNVGIQLDVTPYIGQNNLVQMILQPQDTAIDTSTPGQQIVGSSLFSGAVFAPNINKRSANTVVVTPDGQTVVIGGLIADQKSSNDSKIPLLGDIPLFGHLFKYSAKANQKSELMMFITPHIIRMPSQLASMSANETSQSQLITNSISEQELDRFLEHLPVKKN